MLVIMKALLSGYNTDDQLSTKLEMQRCCASLQMLSRVDLFVFVQYCTICLFFDHSTSTMAAAGPTRGELVPNMVKQ